MTLDGKTYSALGSSQYDVANGVITITTTQDLNCRPGSGSSGAPLSDIVLVLDNRIITLDGSKDALVYALAENRVKLFSRHGAYDCGDPDAVRLLATAAPDTQANALETATITVFNESPGVVNDALIEVVFSQATEVQALPIEHPCTPVDASTLTCVISNLETDQTKSIEFPITTTLPGTASIACTATYSGGRVADEGCSDQWTVAGERPTLTATTQAPETARPRQSISARTTIENTGTLEAPASMLAFTVPDHVTIQSAPAECDSPAVTSINCDLPDIGTGELFSIEFELIAETEGTKTITCGTTENQDIVFNLQTCDFTVHIEIPDAIFVDRFQE